MENYKAGIHYDKASVYHLSKMIIQVKRPRLYPMLYLSSFFIMIAGLFYFTEPLIQITAIALGCFLFTSIPVPAKRQASQNMNMVGKKEFIVNYNFKPESFTMTSTIGQKDEVEYKKIIFLTEDKKYLYIFSNLSSAYMIEKASVNSGGFRELKIFLSKCTNKSWKKYYL